ncbi:protein FAR-RED IMPAIRED RESPONSE 1-like [Olea europaea var. sylvestris]|uniref:protein FAR-RED IMPAIRED RESPONSE 1-like n=1 Tax=Olea europaea var. sylvestris TaxID=158386 RepID=UPI000C1D025B|nr:protein FAR-RED IMPAIRED RESPONSE 1-like [Olea europaea var. sylvestris]
MYTQFYPFVGVNHHGQSTLLGCGLVSNEDTRTFVWLFRTWLQCMHGQAPHGIITDQDRAMQNAIEIVFPHTKHRWCLWHILKKLPEKFGYHVDKASIFSTIHRLVYDSQLVDEFENGWRTMIDTYNLYDNDWLSGLFENRGRWVPCFLKTTFWAGMSTTQRSESMNAFFDGYVHSKTSLKQFVEQYERALRNKVEKEFQADFKSYSQMVPCVTNYDIEKQYQKVYTITKFREVQTEFIGKVYCDIISVLKGCPNTIYEVREDVLLYAEHRMKKIFSVSFTRDTCDIACSCHLFEFRGILCRHAIAVLIRNDVTVLPNKFILRRWRRDVSRAHTRVAIHYDGLISTPTQMRYDEMCQAFSEVVDLAADDEARARAVMEWIKVQAKELILTKSSNGAHRNDVISHGSDSQNHFAVNVLDPILSKKKGAPRKLRQRGPLESSSKKVKVFYSHSLLIETKLESKFSYTRTMYMQASSSSGKGKRPRVRHNIADEGVPNVEASQQCSSLTPLSWRQGQPTIDAMISLWIASVSVCFPSLMVFDMLQEEAGFMFSSFSVSASGTASLSSF